MMPGAATAIVAIAIGVGSWSAVAQGVFEPGAPGESRVSAHGESTTRGATPELIVGHYTGREPSQIDFSSDAGNIVDDIEWTSWTFSAAAGLGMSDDDTCVPDCATAPLRRVRTEIKLTTPRHGHFSVVTELRGDQTMRFTDPNRWLRGAR
jgi:hypothetical protein